MTLGSYAKFAAAVQAVLARRILLADEMLLNELDHEFESSLRKLQTLSTHASSGELSARDLALLNPAPRARDLAEPSVDELQGRDHADVDERDDQLRRGLFALAARLNDVREMGYALKPTLQNQASLAASLGHIDAIVMLAYELRRRGFEYSEIIALCELKSPATKQQRSLLTHRELQEDMKENLRKQLNRLFDRTGDPKPSVNMGVRDPL